VRIIDCEWLPNTRRGNHVASIKTAEKKKK